MTVGNLPNRVLLAIGTYTKTCESDGIYIYGFDSETAGVELLSSTENVVSPSFLSISKDRRFIYSVNENDDNSTVSSFALDSSSANINFLNKKDSCGASPCNILDDRDNVIVANYESGTIAVFSKSGDGKLTDAKQVITHSGNGPNPERQEKSHVHMVGISPDRKHALATNLGSDEIYVYDYRPQTSDVLLFNHKIDVKPGSGPRHFEFGPGGKFLYVLHELDGTLTVFAFREGRLDKIQETTVVEDGFKGEIGAGDIHLTSDGKFLYATNRGDANTISAFNVAPNGRLQLIETIATKGNGPRNFAIAPGDTFLLVAHENSNEVVIFSRDTATGKLSDTGKKIAVCAPACLKFF